MNIAPWVPAALQFGSLVTSGVGSWLDSRDKRNYQNKIAQMQEDARKRAAEAEAIAIKRANRLSLLTGQTVRPEPVDVDLPVISGYKPGTATKIFQGLGFGLGAANLATSALSKAQEYNTKLAEKAAEQQAAVDIMSAMENQPAIGDIKLGPHQGGQWYTLTDKRRDEALFDWSSLTPAQQRVAQQYLEDKYAPQYYTSGDILSKTVADLRKNNPDAALKAVQEDPGNNIQFSGLFSGNAEAAFKGAYAKTMAGAYDTYKRQEITQLGQEAALELDHMRLQASRLSKLISSQDKAVDVRFKLNDNTQKLYEKAQDLVEKSPTMRSLRNKLDSMDLALNLVTESIGPGWVHKIDRETGKYIIDPNTKKPKLFPNEASGLKFDEKTGEFLGYTLSGIVVDGLTQMYQRGLDEGVVHATDVTRINSAIDTWFEVNFKQNFTTWLDRQLGTGPDHPIPLRPEAMLGLIEILDTNADHLRGRLNSNLDGIIDSFLTEELQQNILSGDIYTWNSVEQFQRDFATRIKTPYRNVLKDQFTIPGSQQDLPGFGEFDAQERAREEARRKLRGFADNAKIALNQKGGEEEDPDILELIKPVSEWGEFSDEGMRTTSEVNNYWANSLFKNPDAEPLNIPFANAFTSALAPYTQGHMQSSIGLPINVGKVASDIYGSGEYLRRRAGIDNALQLRGGIFPGLASVLETAAAVPIVAGQQLMNAGAAGANLAQYGLMQGLRNYQGSTVRNYQYWGDQ